MTALDPKAHTQVFKPTERLPMLEDESRCVLLVCSLDWGFGGAYDKTGNLIDVDLSAGARGMSLSFKRVGFDIVAAIEIDPVHAPVDKFNVPDLVPQREQITVVEERYYELVSAAETRSRGGSNDR